MTFERPKPHAAPLAPVRGTRQRQRTRNALLTAGGQMFATRSPDAVTIDEIVEAADVGKGSFYNHFTDKEEFADAIFELIQGDCEFHIFSANRGVRSAPMRIVRALCVVVRYAIDHPERIQALMSLGDKRAVLAAPLNAGAVADVREGLDQGALAHVDLEGGVMVTIGLVRQAVRQATAPKVTTPPSVIATSLGAAMLRALGVEPGLALQYAETAVADILKGKNER